MTTLGITGHINISTATRDLIAAEIRVELAEVNGPIVGFSSLAPGADQVFAEAVLDQGGELVFINPCRDIETSMSGAGLAAFRILRARAVREVVLPYEEPSEDAYLAAGQMVADSVDLLLAVWDGRPAAGKGGTADIVDYCQAQQWPIRIIWPAGAVRGQ